MCDPESRARANGPAAAAAEPVGVLVPDGRGVRAVGAAPGLVPLRYALDGPLPPAATAARVLVPGRGPVERHLDLVRALPGLRLVQLLHSGTEQWAGRLPDSLLLSNARGAHGPCTAEWALAALLAVVREFPEAFASQTRGTWRPFAAETLEGKRVLIVGAGSIGAALRVRLEACGAGCTMVARRARPGVHGRDELSGLLPHHDAVVLAAPLTAESRGMADAEFLALMPDRAVLVNAGRGALVDTGALLAELGRGRLRAALDVTDPEPLPDGHPLWSAPGVLISPHIGGGAGDSEERAWTVAVDQISRFARGLRPPNAVPSL
ncbi:NAD(P)-dependent oxidoreductase [Streptomyces varsoviensis]|uniref:NAD(P)-dependent oxidoreductase n=1 Tax=Streptomyces varsoviensis TaxID=67373 RepID=UPI0033FAE265